MSPAPTDGILTTPSFNSFGMSSREFNRYALDPQGYEQTLRDEDQKPRWFLRSTEKKQLTEDQKSKLRQMKFELMSMKSDRNEPFFRFGGRLENFNFSISEIDAELSEVAGRDPKMIKKKNDFLKRVTKNRESQSPLSAKVYLDRLNREAYICLRCSIMRRKNKKGDINDRRKRPRC